MSDFDKNLKGLLVDDFVVMRSVERAMLAQLGIKNLDEADDGLSALEKARQRSYDFILLDWRMPKMGGAEFLKALRSDPSALRIPVLVVSSAPFKNDLAAARQLGASAYLLKPFTVDELALKLKKALQAR